MKYDVRDWIHTKNSYIHTQIIHIRAQNTFIHTIQLLLGNGGHTLLKLWCIIMLLSQVSQKRPMVLQELATDPTFIRQMCHPLCRLDSSYSLPHALLPLVGKHIYWGNTDTDTSSLGVSFDVFLADLWWKTALYTAYR